MRTEGVYANTSPVPLPDYSSDWEKKTPYSFHGMTLIIEYLAGDVRKKVVGDGIVISNEFPSAYGCILGTTDLHGEEIDFYLASSPSEEECIYVIDQVDPATGMFDEHKVMLGFSSLHEVFHTYTTVFSDGSGPQRIGTIVTFTGDSFNGWLASPSSALKPASSYQADDVSVEKMAGIRMSPKSIAKPAGNRDELGGVVVELVDLSKGPKIRAFPKDDGGFDYHLNFYGPLTHEVWSNPFDITCRTLRYASADDTLHLHIACPGGSVILMGRLISAMNATEAKVITYAEGVVASAATGIWCAGHERRILPGAYFMQHMSSQVLGGKTTDISAKAEFCKREISRQLQNMVDTGLFTPEEREDMIEKSADIYVTGREATQRCGVVSYRKQMEA